MQATTLFLLSFLCISCYLSVCSSSKVLVLLPFSPRSQKNAFDPIVESLVKRNHEVTYVTMYKHSKEMKGVKTILMGNSLIKFVEDFAEHMFNASLQFSFSNVPKIVSVFSDACEVMFHDEQFTNFAKNPGNYDVVIVNSMINECYLPVAAKIGAPIVIVSPPALFPNLAWALNIPNFPSYLPMPMLPYDFQMSFKERVINFIATSAMNLMLTHVVSHLSESAVKKYIPDAPSTYDVIRNASLILINTHVSFEGSRPSMPNMVEVGCIHCNLGNELPQDLKSFVENSGDNGFIVFSLGSVVKGTFMTENFVKTFVKVFGKRKQSVIWKYEKEIKDLPSNIKTVSWLPQQDLMAHPKCKLAIVHGGLLSMQEVAYHGVPMLGVPLGADRVRNIYRASQMGFGLSLDNWANLTEDYLEGILREAIDNPRYREKAQEISKLMKDRPAHPVETATYWIEYIIRHKGAKHLRSAAQHLNFVQYYSLDVIGFLLLILTFFILLLVFILKMLFKCLCKACAKSKKPSKAKKNN